MDSHQTTLFLVLLVFIGYLDRYLCLQIFQKTLFHYFQISTKFRTAKLDTDHTQGPERM